MKIKRYARIRERIAVEQREADYRAAAADRPPQRRKERETSRLLEILDDLAVENLRAQAFEETAAREDSPR
jgi:hypothetical protein